MPVRELVAIRLAEGDSFAAFRAALTKAAQDMMNNNQGVSSQGVAKSAVDDVVRPELARIELKLRAAKRALTRKTAVSLVLGALATKCGLLLGVGSAAAEVAGIGAFIAGSGTAGSKYIEEKQTIELSDMYFLWKALGHAA
ncbi:MAG: hypothetical protein ACREA9_04190 [Pyrinomonadaceae bacterium]